MVPGLGKIDFVYNNLLPPIMMTITMSYSKAKAKWKGPFLKGKILTYFGSDSFLLLTPSTYTQTLLSSLLARFLTSLRLYLALSKSDLSIAIC